MTAIFRKGKKEEITKKTKKTMKAQIANLHKWVELRMLCKLAGSQCMREEVGEEESMRCKDHSIKADKS